MVSFSFQASVLLVLVLLTGIQSRSIESRSLARRGFEARSSTNSTAGPCCPAPFWIKANGLWLTKSGQLSTNDNEAVICKINQTTGMACGDYTKYISSPKTELTTKLTSEEKPPGGYTAGWLVNSPSKGVWAISWTTPQGHATFVADEQDILWATFEGKTVPGGKPVDLTLVHWRRPT